MQGQCGAPCGIDRLHGALQIGQALDLGQHHIRQPRPGLPNDGLHIGLESGVIDRVLREHLTQGYSLDRERFERNAAELEAALQLVRKAAAGQALSAEQGRGLVDVIARYTQTFLWLQRYDEGLLTVPAGSPGGVLPTLEEAHAAIARLKADLMARGEASDLFGRERGDAFAALLGNLEQ